MIFSMLASAAEELCHPRCTSPVSKVGNVMSESWVNFVTEVRKTVQGDPSHGSLGIVDIKTKVVF